MKKITSISFMVLAAAVLFFAATPAMAGVFTPPQGSKITAATSSETGTVQICWEGFEVSRVDVYYMAKADADGKWSANFKPDKNCAILGLEKKDGFQLVDPKGNFLLIPNNPSEWNSLPYKLYGIVISSNNNSAHLEVSP